MTNPIRYIFGFRVLAEVVMHYFDIDAFRGYETVQVYWFRLKVQLLQRIIIFKNHKGLWPSQFG